MRPRGARATVLLENRRRRRCQRTPTLGRRRLAANQRTVLGIRCSIYRLAPAFAIGKFDSFLFITRLDIDDSESAALCTYYLRVYCFLGCFVNEF